MQSWSDYLCDDEGISVAERDLRRGVFRSAAGEGTMEMVQWGEWRERMSEDVEVLAEDDGGPPDNEDVLLAVCNASW